MQLQPGTRLGPYVIVDQAGAGGMGEVYRARDTRLPRAVAIKILPSELAGDPQRRARFEREARTISTLSHPNICTLHDVGRENGVDYLVLELCEGQTLAQRLDRGPLPVEQVLRHGREIAAALSQAHRAGIVHRDLKPSNVMLTKTGVKLLDFGLAVQRGVESVSADTATLQRRQTAEGTLVGSVPYMAPEVLSGKEADARSDIFALGMLLYEMLTGQRAFRGESRAAVIAAIVEDDPIPLHQLQPDTPAELEHLVRKCLAKSPEERWESAHDVAEQLQWIAEAPPRPSKPARWSAAVAIAACVIAAIAAGIVLLRPKPEERIVRLSIPLSESERGGSAEPPVFGRNGNPNIAISPDGKRIAYFVSRGGMSRLYVRQLDAFESTPIETDGGGGPFFSPDGRWIGFTSARGLKKVAVTGGEAQTLHTSLLGLGRGAVWAPDGSIYFAPGTSTGLWKVNGNGGAARELTRPNAAAGETSHRFPDMLPDGKHLLFTIRTDRIATFDDAKIAVLSLDTGRWNVILEGGTCARYVPTGHILFARAGALYAVPFDAASLTIRGTAQKVVDDVLMSPAMGVAEYATGGPGHLAYFTGGLLTIRPDLLTVDRGGRVLTTATVPFTVDRAGLSLSPDGRKLALTNLAANNDIWLYDIETGLATRFSFEPGDERSPVFTADGARVIYAAVAPQRILIRNADGSGNAEELLRSTYPIAVSCSPDGSLLAYDDRDPVTGFDVWLLPLKGDRTPRPLVKTEFQDVEGVFSPDGRWIAYVSNETGTFQVYVRSPLQDSARWQVSAERGQQPRWSQDGRELFYRDGMNFYVVPIAAAGNELRPGKPALLFTLAGVTEYAVRKDGMFLMLREPPEPMRQINVVTHWQRELAALH
jgi:serine/threonine protein kinase/Tol biopolymer transport system component